MHQRRIGRRREDTSRSRSSSASCSPRVSDGGGGIITPRRDPRPSFFPRRRLHAAKAADGLRVKSRRKKPPGRVNEEDDFDRGEKRDDESGEKEEEKKRFFVTTTSLPAARGRRLNRFRGSRTGRGLARDARVARIISAQRESGGVFIREGELAGGDAIEKSDV